jgi:hypothetical protein
MTDPSVRQHTQDSTVMIFVWLIQFIKKDDSLLLSPGIQMPHKLTSPSSGSPANFNWIHSLQQETMMWHIKDFAQLFGSGRFASASLTNKTRPKKWNLPFRRIHLSK